MDIQIVSVSKQYGRVRALDNVSLQIGKGMFGLLGPNGSGKTTLMRILTTTLLPTSGRVMVDGLDALRDPHAVRCQLGYLPQDFGFYRGLNAFEMLDYIATMKQIPRFERKRQVEHVLEQVNLTDSARRRVSGYSGGMKQRLGIAQALLGAPRLLVVDEPTAGLDPEERIRFRNLLVRIAGERTVLLSTHIVADIEASCNGVAVLQRGRVVFCGALATLTAAAQDRVWQVEATQSEWERLQASYQVLASRPTGTTVQLRLLADENPLGRGELATPGLEDGYMAVLEGKREAVYA